VNKKTHYYVKKNELVTFVLKKHQGQEICNLIESINSDKFIQKWFENIHVYGNELNFFFKEKIWSNLKYDETDDEET
jgi:hypothetical protein